MRNTDSHFGALGVLISDTAAVDCVYTILYTIKIVCFNLECDFSVALFDELCLLI